ncbi:hypothetical protein BHE74_00055399 [Ensete ventricosum]|nr:hypothetical protein GW17_00047649 [Ensete ventricosum]RWW39287.1 hypothetical protein BHE74_00055399 [Ensete ventricosum]RZR97739.1 hypothetical protein BHM03_00026998 [Ensete ventricosum]
MVVSVCAGTVYFDIGKSYTAIQARASCGGFISGFMTFMSIGGFPCFIEEMKVFTHERLNGHYGVAVYILSNFLSSSPFLVAIAFTTGSITYFMVKFRKGNYDDDGRVLSLATRSSEACLAISSFLDQLCRYPSSMVIFLPHERSGLIPHLNDFPCMFKEKASPVFRMIYARVTLKQIMKLKRRTMSSSSRHPRQHPMALQEGLGSPPP